MTFIGLTIVLIAVFIGSLMYNKKSRVVQSYQRSTPWIVILLLVIVSLWSSMKIVPTGNVGIIYQFGSIVDQKPEGLQMIPPWNEMKLADIRIQKHTFSNLECFSLETQNVTLSLTLNFKVSPTIIQDLYRNIGPRYFDVIIFPKIPQIVKDETVKYKAVDIAPNREALRVSIRERLKSDLESYSIEVVDVLLEDIYFSAEFEQSIEMKQIATQKALEEQEIVKQEKYKAEQQITRAQGEAEANRLISESLSPEILQYTMIEKLADDIKIIMLPSNQSFILSPDALIEAK
ncbi:MAG TPA: prohibitin family protein [Caldisericia bacterium]|nr:prohibitin family protein [Caldisericia bacterium]HXK51002.1 prohibitin family protein [Caldisericia bacterium]